MGRSNPTSRLVKVSFGGWPVKLSHIPDHTRPHQRLAERIHSHTQRRALIDKTVEVRGEKNGRSFADNEIEFAQGLQPWPVRFS